MNTQVHRWLLHIDGSSLPGRELIGGKAWSIAEMRTLGLNVPPAVVLTTSACIAFQECGDLPPGLDEELRAGIAWLEQRTGRRFGAGPRPLLVSVRSGAPGMNERCPTGRESRSTLAMAETVRQTAGACRAFIVCSSQSAAGVP